MNRKPGPGKTRELLIEHGQLGGAGSHSSVSVSVSWFSVRRRRHCSRLSRMSSGRPFVPTPGPAQAALQPESTSFYNGTTAKALVWSPLKRGGLLSGKASCSRVLREKVLRGMRTRPLRDRAQRLESPARTIETRASFDQTNHPAKQRNDTNEKGVSVAHYL